MPSRSVRTSTEEEASHDDDIQYGNGLESKEELESRYADRPRNHSKTPPFHELFKALFDPLNDNKKKSSGPTTARAKQGPHGSTKLSPHEMRSSIIERFISRWRNDIGDDFYPAMRLIIPERDRDRPMYGLKEKAIGRLLVKLLKLNPSSDDGFNLLNWKLPGQTSASRMAGDFAGRCYEVLSKRPMRTSVGNLRIAEVNQLLDKLAAAQKEDTQLPVFEEFYEQMNADELMWIIRIILRQMKLGASEKTFLNIWHPDGEALFNVSSSLRRVCWELTNPSIRLTDDHASIALGSCFQPQLAQFQMHSLQMMVEKLGTTPENPYWIEEKLDGERMQMHMMTDETVPGGKRFAFWSRKAKDYTYLYGKTFEDETSALTQHLKNAFDPSVMNIILDGEMITWDPESDTMVPFGTLKTAALGQQRNPFGTGIRPLFRVFDCLYVNKEDITRYTLNDRYKALRRCVKDVHRRLEVHTHDIAFTADDIEPKLRKVVAESSEGLVLKNPLSRYRLNSRNDDWMKVKPEYMTEFGESLDCVIIGGYYGSGHKGGRLSSFLCGLRVDQNDVQSQGTNPMKFYSFFKVGGGFRAEDYANIMHHTDGKWVEFDRNHPPTEYMELGGSDGLNEKPDVWIKPSDSVVVEVKAASVGPTDAFKTSYTLRFPRFKRLRMDKDWKSALSIFEFLQVKATAEAESKKEMKIDNSRRKISKRLKREVIIAGNESKVKTPYAGPSTKIFDGLNFYVLSEMLRPRKKSKAELEEVIKSNGGAIFQSPTAREDMICIGDKNVVKVASLVKKGRTSIVRPAWILDALRQSEADGSGRARFLIPFERNYMFHMTPDAERSIGGNVDGYKDSYARDSTVEELKTLLESMILPKHSTFSARDFVSELEERGNGFGEMPGSMFRGCVAWFESSSGGELEHEILSTRFRFADGLVANSRDDQNVTHIVVVDEASIDMKKLREAIAGAGRRKIPRIVKEAWVGESWMEKTLLDEERYAVGR